MTDLATGPTTDDLDALRRGLRGRVVGPEDAGYDALRAIILGGIDPRPAAIVRPADAAVPPAGPDGGYAFAFVTGHLGDSERGERIEAVLRETLGLPAA